ncbi:MAG: site-2 protease family protein [Thermoleophilia bacterium]|nr:site-2 protease family protein [Thermoleophilia bacterium]
MFYLVAILGIGLLILVHELGHFLTAKAFGMRAEKFYIGFPPAAVKKKIGETEYGIGFVPLGGYVKISGMTREEELPEEVRPRAYYARPIWQRVIVISAGAFMNVLLAVFLFFIFYWQALPEFQATGEIAAVQEDSGAERAGIEPGDRLIGVNGFSSEDVQALRDELKARPDQQVQITVEREGEILMLPTEVGRAEETGEGLLGVFFDAERVGTLQIPVTEALWNSVSDIGFITREVFIVIKNLFVSSEARQDITSPIGIVAISTQTIEMGWGVYLRVLGFISLQLAILNMLPLLPLDGGHVLFNILEKIKGSPIRRDIFERVSLVGLMLFIILLTMGVMNDIQRLLGPGFQIEP